MYLWILYLRINGIRELISVDPLFTDPKLLRSGLTDQEPFESGDNLSSGCRYGNLPCSTPRGALSEKVIFHYITLYGIIRAIRKLEDISDVTTP